MQPLVLITRPIKDAATFADVLHSHHYRTLIEPMLYVTSTPENYAALRNALQKNRHTAIITSRNALRAMELCNAPRDMHLLIVGESTAEMARNLDFHNVSCVGENVANLMHYLTKNTTITSVPLLYPRGLDVHMEITVPLKKKGYSVQEIIAYNTTPAKHLSETLKETLLSNAYTAATFFSERTASVFVTLAQCHSVPLERCTAFCLSSRIAEKVSALTWQDIIISKNPTQSSLVESIDKWRTSCL